MAWKDEYHAKPITSEIEQKEKSVEFQEEKTEFFLSMLNPTKKLR